MVTLSTRIPVDVRREMSDHVLGQEGYHLSEFAGELLVEAWESYRETHGL